MPPHHTPAPRAVRLPGSRGWSGAGECFPQDQAQSGLRDPPAASQDALGSAAWSTWPQSMALRMGWRGAHPPPGLLRGSLGLPPRITLWESDLN